MRADEGATVPVCSICGLPWLPADPDRWFAHVIADPTEVIFLCPLCERIVDEEISGALPP